MTAPIVDTGGRQARVRRVEALARAFMEGVGRASQLDPQLTAADVLDALLSTYVSAAAEYGLLSQVRDRVPDLLRASCDRLIAEQLIGDAAGRA
jgi:hypothetical protein